jgi:hypothetical protein
VNTGSSTQHPDTSNALDVTEGLFTWREGWQTVFINTHDPIALTGPQAAQLGEAIMNDADFGLTLAPAQNLGRPGCGRGRASLTVVHSTRCPGAEERRGIVGEFTNSGEAPRVSRPMGEARGAAPRSTGRVELALGQNASRVLGSTHLRGVSVSAMPVHSTRCPGVPSAGASLGFTTWGVESSGGTA